MSTSVDPRKAVAACRPADGTPVSITADVIESTADPYLQRFKEDLEGEGYVPSELVIEAEFDADCSLRTQSEADRIRDLIYAADYLSVSKIRVEIDCIADRDKVLPAISALHERAAREGLTLDVNGLDTDDL